ncbi:MAG TPA: amidohydrolase family protein [Acidimicrobiales bacterium]|nr:amidohydrolase family protein [Acidimicrobiales bacterium]
MAGASVAGRSVLLPDGRLVPAVVEIDGATLAGVTPVTGEGARDLPDRVVAPGFVDLQVNGHDDVDVAGAEGADWDRLDQLLLAQGVTAWCPTLVTAPLGSYGPALRRIEAAGRRTGPRPAVLGAHLEGPFLGGLTGAHDVSWVRPLDPDWLAALPPSVRIVTLGPELAGAPEAVALLADRGVVVALGHTAAGFDEAGRAAAAGARMVTHLFNAMSPLHHREPGLVGAALTDPRLTPSLIADLVHVHPAVVLAAFRARAGLGPGPGDPGVALVTDAVGWRSGHVGGIGLRRREGDAPRRPDGTIAGSALTMDRAVANCVAVGVSPAAALAAASLVPARLVGEVGRGRIEAGARADLVVLSPDLGVLETWVGGDVAWRADGG